ncbi:J domain-containing protein [Halomarina litorea]|uniref:J domain-containing protein n=1 Tax=Halomarina litorea TaxID=2961595 RepID=UPI003F5D81D6
MLGAVFGALAAFLAVLGLVVEPLLLLLAVPFGVVTYFMWYQASGRLVERVYASVEGAARVDDTTRARARTNGGGRGGFGAGPREEWDPASEWARRERVGGPEGRRRTGRAGASGQRDRRKPQTASGPTRLEAYDILGLDPQADQRAVKRAYRERVKTAHPDTPEGSEEEFKRVNAAYERLSE